MAHKQATAIVGAKVLNALVPCKQGVGGSSKSAADPIVPHELRITSRSVAGLHHIKCMLWRLLYASAAMAKAGWLPYSSR